MGLDSRIVQIEQGQEKDSVSISYELEPSDMRLLARKRLRCDGFPTLMAKVKRHAENLGSQTRGTIGYKIVGRQGYNIYGHETRKTVEFYEILRNFSS